MNRDLCKRTINEDCSILSALELMERGETRTLYRCDSNGVLLSVVTEGDLRRLLLQGQTLIRSYPKARQTSAASHSSSPISRIQIRWFMSY